MGRINTVVDALMPAAWTYQALSLGLMPGFACCASADWVCLWQRAQEAVSDEPDVLYASPGFSVC